MATAAAAPVVVAATGGDGGAMPPSAAVAAPVAAPHGDVHNGVRTWLYESPSEAAAADAAEAVASHKAATATGSLDVLLYYKYVELDAPAVATMQHDLCHSLRLTGRVLVGPEGINGSLAGAAEDTAAYIATMDAHESFGGIDWKHSEARDEPFPDLCVRHAPPPRCVVGVQAVVFFGTAAAVAV